MKAEKIKKWAKNIAELAGALEQEIWAWVEDISEDFMQIILTDAKTIREYAEAILEELEGEDV